MSAETPSDLPPHEREGQEPEKSESLFQRLIPILFVGDLEAERDFYVRLGFTVSYQGPEFPDFIALAAGSIEFGIERKQDFASDLPEPVLIWQFGVRDIEITKQRLTSAGVSYHEEWVTPREDWKYRILRARTPNGYRLMLEGAAE
jgi:catechol 2,3-dioxygenase-like lactoylglutathione lyase family enzyme